MDEAGIKSETPHYSREQVIEAFRKFSLEGISHPDELDMSKPEIADAHKLLDSWSVQEENFAKKKGSAEADLEYKLSRDTIFVDAGFSDPDYLDEVANDWLIQDLDGAETAGLTEAAKKIQTKMDEINAKLKK